MNDSVVLSSRVADQIEDVLQYLPENPVTGYVEGAWQSMLQNYTKFQIATWGSLLVHEVYVQHCLYNFTLKL